MHVGSTTNAPRLIVLALLSAAFAVTPAANALAATPTTPYDEIAVDAPDGQTTGRWAERIVAAGDLDQRRRGRSVRRRPEPHHRREQQRRPGVPPERAYARGAVPDRLSRPAGRRAVRLLHLRVRRRQRRRPHGHRDRHRRPERRAEHPPGQGVGVQRHHRQHALRAGQPRSPVRRPLRLTDRGRRRRHRRRPRRRDRGRVEQRHPGRMRRRRDCGDDSRGLLSQHWAGLHLQRGDGQPRAHPGRARGRPPRRKLLHGLRVVRHRRAEPRRHERQRRTRPARRGVEPDHPARLSGRPDVRVRGRQRHAAAVDRSRRSHSRARTSASRTPRRTRPATSTATAAPTCTPTASRRTAPPARGRAARGSSTASPAPSSARSTIRIPPRVASSAGRSR